ncbi:cellulose binding domain-containing protein [Aquiflexum lacus]|uniref:cellulose binding domain-containing protein n=1 Tax=Aquiflexum lacus TaxID=2483805 RepID=UPI001894F2EC|nr:cellulose binding domain-containing protein [Aquiflexum lacus]
MLSYISSFLYLLIFNNYRGIIPVSGIKKNHQKFAYFKIHIPLVKWSIFNQKVILADKHYFLFVLFLLIISISNSHSQSIKEGVYNIRSVANEKTLHSSNEAYTQEISGFYTITFPVSSSDVSHAQKWKLIKLNDGSFNIVNIRYWKSALTSVERLVEDGPDSKYVITSEINDSDFQRWEFIEVKDGIYNIINKGNGLSLTSTELVYSPNPNGEYLLVSPLQNDESQQWRLNVFYTEDQVNSIGLPNVPYKFINIGTSKFLHSTSQTNSATGGDYYPIVFELRSSQNQGWYFLNNIDGSFKIENLLYSGRVLTRSNRDLASGTEDKYVTLAVNSIDSRKNWIFTPQGGSIYKIFNQSDNSVFSATDLPFTSNPIGRYVGTKTDLDDADQLWAFQISNQFPVSEISLDRPSIVLGIGDTDQLFTSVLPEYATYKDVFWSSENPEIATVDRDGNITGLSVGVTKILATTLDGRLFVHSEIKVKAQIFENTTFYVSLDGNNINDGLSKETAWKTLDFAASQVDPDRGNSVELSAGIHLLNSTIYLPSEISLIGQGSDKTTIRGNWENNDEDFRRNIGKLIEIVGGKRNHLIANISFDGNDRKISGAISNVNSDSLEVVNCLFKNFGSSALKIENSSFSKVYESEFIESGYEATDGTSWGSLGMIHLYKTTHNDIHDIYFESTLPGTGYAIKSGNRGNQGTLERYTDNYLKDSKFYRLKTRLKPRQTWNNVANFAIELHHNIVERNEIFDSDFDRTVSLSNEHFPQTAPTIRFHHNYVHPSSFGFGYWIEVKTSYLEIDHNFFDGGITGFNDFSRDCCPLRDIKIHHNIAQNVTRFFGDQGRFQNLQIHNNTVVFTNNPSPSVNPDRNRFYYNETAGQDNGIWIKNNLIIAPESLPGRLFTMREGASFPNEIEFERNLIYNIDTLVASNLGVKMKEHIVGSPLLLKEGEVPIPYYGLSMESPAIDAGVLIEGITDDFKGSSPDIGAVESEYTFGLKLLYLNGNKKGLNNNQIRPEFSLENMGDVPIDLSQITAKYWFTPEEYAPILTWIDYSPLGKENIYTQYEELSNPRQKAFGYLSYSFDKSAGKLEAGLKSGLTKSRIAKSDFTTFNEENDYSYLKTSSKTENNRFTLYRNGILVWGEEPEIEDTESRVSIHSRTIGNNSNTNLIRTHLILKNEGNSKLDYQDLSFRYWFNSNGNSELKNWIDYAKLGKEFVITEFFEVTPPFMGGDTYLEFKIDPAANTLHPFSSTGEIQSRTAKGDWSTFEQSNHHSYLANSDYQENEHITVYYRGELLFGIEPSQIADISEVFSNSDEELIIFPNPTENYIQFNLELDPISEIVIIDSRNQVVFQGFLPRDGILPIDNLRKGLYLIKVNMRDKIFTGRLLKN